MGSRLIRIALAALVLTASAYANVIFTSGNHPQPHEENILFQMNQTGTTIDGATDISGTLVQFSSTTDTLIGKGGQGTINASDGEINNITMTVPGRTFLDAVINPFKPHSNNDLTVTVATNTGTFMTTYGATHGDNFLTITAAVGTVIDSVTISSASGFQDLRQPRLSAISGIPVVPEPSSILLLGGGLLVFIQGLRRKLS